MWIALLVGLFGMAASPYPAELQQAELAVVGPLTRVELVRPDGGRTTVLIELPSGQRRRLRVPLGSSITLRGEIAVEVEGAGSAELASVRTPERSWPSSLSRRGRPPVSAPLSEAGGAELALLAALGFFLVAVRRRAGLALGLGAVGALGFALLQPSNATMTVQILEGRVDSAVWLRVERSSLHPAGVELGPCEHIELEPDRVAVDWMVRSAGQDLAWTARGARGAVTCLAAREPLELSVDRNGAWNLEIAWLRQPGGEWTHLGPWPAGAAVPEARPGPDPPGWAIRALPLGQAVLIGRSAAAGRSSWVRVVGSTRASTGISVED